MRRAANRYVVAFGLVSMIAAPVSAQTPSASSTNADAPTSAIQQQQTPPYRLPYPSGVVDAKLVPDVLNCNAHHPASHRMLSQENIKPFNFEVIVKTDGSVGDISVLQSSGDQTLDEHGMDCVRQHWKFVPAMQNGQPVEVVKTYRIVWTVSQSAIHP